MELNEMIAVMQHYANGGKVEWKSKNENRWHNSETLTWDWRDNDYRIVREPKVVYINEYDTVLSYVIHATEEGAKQSASSVCKRIGVKYMEVVE